MQRSIVAVTAILWVASGMAQAGERLRWEALDARLSARTAAFALADGTRLEGKVLGVHDNGMHVNVTKSSDRRAHPKGDQMIPREAFTELRVTDYGKKGRLIGTLGMAAIAGGILAASPIYVEEGYGIIIAPIAIVGGLVGGAIGGYYAGKAYDKKVTEITIVW